MPKTIAAMLSNPQPGDYWSEGRDPLVLVVDAPSEDCLIVISDWTTRGVRLPRFSTARQVSHEEFLTLLTSTTRRGLRGYRVMMNWVEVWKTQFHGNYALNLSNDTASDESRWGTVH